MVERSAAIFRRAFAETGWHHQRREVITATTKLGEPLPMNSPRVRSPVRSSSCSELGTRVSPQDRFRVVQLLNAIRVR